MSIAFYQASQKLLNPPEGVDVFLLTDLPKNVNSPLWDQIQRIYQLSLPEVSVLQNHATIPGKK